MVSIQERSRGSQRLSSHEERTCSVYPTNWDTEETLQAVHGGAHHKQVFRFHHFGTFLFFIFQNFLSFPFLVFVRERLNIIFSKVKIVATHDWVFRNFILFSVFIACRYLKLKTMAGHVPFLLEIFNCVHTKDASSDPRKRWFARFEN